MSNQSDPRVKPEDYYNDLQRLYYGQQQSQLQGIMTTYERGLRQLQLQQITQQYNQQIWQQQQGMAEMAATPEKKIKDKVKKALEDMDVYYAMPFTAGYGNSGVPDFLVCIEGKFFGIECKAGKNTTTALQEKHLSDIRAAGGVSLVIDETNVDNVKALILANLGDK